MGAEYELKFRATEAIQTAIMEDHPGSWQQLPMQTTYYDTPSGSLSARRYMLRKRLEDGVSVCTLKTPGTGGQRGEWEVQCEHITTAVSELCKLDGVKINGAHNAPHILNLSIPGVPTQNSINLLQDRGICVSAGSACAKGHRSHTLTAMKLPPEVMDSSFRISLSRDTTKEEIHTFIKGIQAILTWKNR